MNTLDKIKKAREKGYSDKEIFGFLKTKGIKEGYSEQEVSGFLQKKYGLGEQPSFIKEQLQREEQFIGDIFKSPSMLGQIPVPIQKAVTPLIPGTQFLPEIAGMGPLELAEKAYKTKLAYPFRRPGEAVRAGIEELQTKPILDKTVFKRLFTAAKEGLTTERKVLGSQIAENMGIRNPVAKAVMGVWYDITTEPLIMGSIVTGAARGRIVKSIEKEAIKRYIKLNPDVSPDVAEKVVTDFMKTPGFKTSVGSLKFSELRQKAKAFTQKAKSIKPETVIKEVKPTPPVTPKSVSPEKSIIRVEAEILKATGKPSTTITKYVKDTVANGEALRKTAEKVMSGTITQPEAIKKVIKDIDKLEKPKVKPKIIKVGVGKGKGKVDLEKAVDKSDYRSILKAGGVKYPEVEMKNFSPEEKRKIQLLFSKGGQDIDSWQDEVQSMYPQLEIKDAYDLMRKAIDQTGKELKTSEQALADADDELNKYMEARYESEEDFLREQGRTTKDVQKTISKEDIETEAVEIGAGGYPEIWDDESLVVKEQLSLFGKKPEIEKSVIQEMKKYKNVKEFTEKVFYRAEDEPTSHKGYLNPQEFKAIKIADENNLLPKGTYNKIKSFLLSKATQEEIKNLSLEKIFAKYYPNNNWEAFFQDLNWDVFNGKLDENLTLKGTLVFKTINDAKKYGEKINKATHIVSYLGRNPLYLSYEPTLGLEKEGKVYHLEEAKPIKTFEFNDNIEQKLIDFYNQTQQKEQMDLFKVQPELPPTKISKGKKEIVTELEKRVAEVAQEKKQLELPKEIKAYHQFEAGEKEVFREKRDLTKATRTYSQAEEGIYFSPNKELLKAKYGKTGGKMVEVVLDMKNPLNLGSNDAMYFDGRKINYGELVVENFKRKQKGEKVLPEPDIIIEKITKKAKEWLQKKGYDSIIGSIGKEKMDVMPEYVVFNKSQIKSKPEKQKIEPKKYVEKYGKIAEQEARKTGLKYQLNKQDVENLSQDLKVKLLKIDWDDYVKGEDIGGYIRTSLRRKTIDILKKKWRKEGKTVALEEFFPVAGEGKPGIKVSTERFPGVDERTGESIEQITRIITEPKVEDTVLKELTNKQMVDILMRNPALTSKEQGYMRLVLKGNSQKEIAKQMNLSEGQMSKIATSAKDKAQDYQWWKLGRGKKLIRDWQEQLKVKQAINTYGSVEKQNKAISDLTSKVGKTRIEGKVKTFSDIKNSLAKNGRVDYRGIKVRNAQHIAELFQVFRDQKAEHLHLIYLDKNNKILAHNTMSSGAVDYVVLSDKEHFFAIANRMKKLGATGLNLVHNHPSGNVKPSPEDVKFTEQISRKLRVAVESIVINHDKYSVIHRFDPVEENLPYTPKMPDWTIKDPAIDSPQKVIDWFRGMRISPDTVTVGYLDSNLGMIAYEPYNKEILNRGTLPETIRQKIKAYGARAYFVSGETINKEDFAYVTYPYGLQDVIIKTGEDSYVSLRGRRQLPFIEKAKTKPGRYLREEPKEYDISKALTITKKDRLVKFLKRYFTATRGVAKQVNTLNKNRAMAIVADQFDSFTTAKKVQKWIDKTGVKSEELIEDVLIGDVSADNVPIEIRPEVIRMREDIDTLSKLLAKHGVAPVTTRIVIQNNIGKYLTRKYKLFEDRTFVPKPEDVRGMADYMEKQFKKKFPLLKLDKSELIGKIKQLAAKQDIALNIRGRAITVPTNHYVKRKNLPVEVKKFYGEIHQPVWRYLKTISQLTTDVHTTLFFNTIKDYSSKTPTKAQFKRLPDDKKWGALRDRYVDESLYDFLHDAMNPIAMSEMGRVLETFLVIPFKWTKTVGSIPTHARNTLGNVMFSLLSRTAITNPLNWGHYTKALDIILRRTTAHREEWKYLTKRRVLEVQYIGGEIANFEVKNFMKGLLKENPANWPEKIFDFTVKKPIKIANMLYNMEDQIYRVAFALKHPEDIKNVDRYYTNYKDMPIAVNVIRKFAGFGVFFSFKYNVARIVSENAKEGIKEAKKGNFGKLATLIFALSFPALLRKASMIAGDIDEEEIKKLEDIMPVYRKNASFVYYRDKWGDLKAFDLTFIWPTGDYERAIRALLKGDMQSFTDSLNLFAHPLFDAWSIMMQGEHPYMHYQVSDSKDSMIRQAADRATALVKNIYLPASMPIPSITALLKEEGKLRTGPLTGYQIKVLLDSYNEISDRYGKIRDFPEELKNFFTGIRTFQMFPEKIIANKLFQLNTDRRRVERKHNWWITNNPDAPQWEKDKQEKIFEKRLENIEKELKKAEELEDVKFF